MVYRRTIALKFSFGSVLFHFLVIVIYWGKKISVIQYDIGQDGKENTAAFND